MTRVVNVRPPNYARIVETFGPLPPSVVFAYGDTIYAPGASGPLPPDLVVHEETHFRQQAEVGGPATWWERYLADPEFRLLQEVEAYRAQIACHPDRPSRRRCKARVAKDLVRLYALRGLTTEQARRLLQAATS
jgi:hypothetical protein